MFRRLGTILIILLALSQTTGCSSSKEEALGIRFSADSTTIVVDHIDAVGLHQLKAGKFADLDTEVLISVLDTPSEEDSLGMEREVEGTIVIVDDHLEFRPEKPFVKGRQYEVISYLNTSFGNLESTVKGKTSYQVKPNQKLLRR
jgi:hypothetical protein